MAPLTIPKNLVKNSDLVVLEKKDFEKLSKENEELKSAIKAVLAGELALHQGKTRTLKEFLKYRSQRYAKGF